LVREGQQRRCEAGRPAPARGADAQVNADPWRDRYQTTATSDACYFHGVDGRSDVRYEVDGMSVAVPADLHATTVVVTVMFQ